MMIIFHHDHTMTWYDSPFLSMGVILSNPAAFNTEAVPRTIEVTTTEQML